MTDRIDVPSTLWYDRLPQTPVLRETENEVGFAVVPGRSPQGPTVVLAGRYYLEPPILDDYGGQLPSPVRAVAIDAQTGAVYSKELVEEKSPPVFVMVPEDAPPSSGGGRASGGSFNVDLPAHVGLPPHAGTYHVFLWIDHVLSAAQDITLDENAHRTSAPLSARKPDDVLHFGAAHTLSAEPGAITLRAVKPHSREVEGAWTPDPARLQDHKTPYVLTVLAFNHRDRSFGWAAADLHALPAGADAAHFHLDASLLTGAGPGEQKVFVLAFAGGTLSKVLVLPPS